MALPIYIMRLLQIFHDVFRIIDRVIKEFEFEAWINAKNKNWFAKLKMRRMKMYLSCFYETVESEYKELF